jgi:hypothetical protein
MPAGKWVPLFVQKRLCALCVATHSFSVSRCVRLFETYCSTVPCTSSLSESPAPEDVDGAPTGTGTGLNHTTTTQLSDAECITMDGGTARRAISRSGTWRCRLLRRCGFT